MNTKNNKTNEPRRFRLTLGDRLNLKDLNKNMTLANLIIYYTFITKILSLHIAAINLKSLLKLGIMSLI